MISKRRISAIVTFILVVGFCAYHHLQPEKRRSRCGIDKSFLDTLNELTAMDSFYVHLSSNVISNDDNNSLASFSTNLANVLNFEEDYEVALVEISFSDSWFNLREDGVIILKALTPTVDRAAREAPNVATTVVMPIGYENISFTTASATDDPKRAIAMEIYFKSLDEKNALVVKLTSEAADLEEKLFKAETDKAQIVEKAEARAKDAAERLDNIRQATAEELKKAEKAQEEAEVEIQKANQELAAATVEIQRLHELKSSSETLAEQAANARREAAADMYEARRVNDAAKYEAAEAQEAKAKANQEREVANARNAEQKSITAQHNKDVSDLKLQTARANKETERQLALATRTREQLEIANGNTARAQALNATLRADTARAKANAQREKMETTRVLADNAAVAKRLSEAETAKAVAIADLARTNAKLRETQESRRKTTEEADRQHERVTAASRDETIQKGRLAAGKVAEQVIRGRTDNLTDVSPNPQVTEPTVKEKLARAAIEHFQRDGGLSADALNAIFVATLTNDPNIRNFKTAPPVMVPAGRYKTIEELVQKCQSLMDSIVKNVEGPTIIAGSDGAVHVYASPNVTAYFDNSLRLLLGGLLPPIAKLNFTQAEKESYCQNEYVLNKTRCRSAIEEKALDIPKYGDISGGLQSIYIYTNIIRHGLVGNILTPLLKVIHVRQNATFGEQIFVESNIPEFKNLSSNTIQHIEISLHDDRGRLVPFKFGRVRCTLLFRPKR